MVTISLIIKKIIRINHTNIPGMLGTSSFLNIRQLNICLRLLNALIDRMPLYSGGNILNERLPRVAGSIVNTAR